MGKTASRIWVLAGVLWITSFSLWPQSEALSAPATDSIDLNIPAGNLTAALDRFAEQSGLQIVYDQPLDNAAQAKALIAHLPRGAALDQLLKGTGLTWGYVNDSTVVVRQAKRKGTDAAKAAAATAAAAATEEGPVSADVSVQSKRVIQAYEPGGNVDIPRTVDDVQPYYIYSSESIEQSGATNLEEFLKQYLTMNSTVQTNSQMYGILGGSPKGNTSTFNLRGLGPDNTLILVNGHRMAGVSVNGNSGQPDINSIPLAAVDHIEVLPSSWSGIYGGSAMGGVINIILKKNYKGGDVSVTREQVTHGHAADTTLDGSYGFSLEDGKTQAMVSAHFFNSEPLLLGDRAGLVSSGLNRVSQAEPSLFTNGGSGAFQGGTLTNVYGGYICGPTGCNLENLLLLNGKSLGGSNTSLVCAKGISPHTTPAAVFDACFLKNAGRHNINLAPGLGEFGLQQPIGYAPRVESVVATLNRSMSSWLDAFIDLTITKNDATSEYNPIADTSWQIYPGIPTNPFQGLVLTHIPVETSVPLIADSLTRAITAGLTAQLPGEWRSELDFTWSENSFDSSYGQVNADLFDGIATGPFADISGVNGALVTGAVNPFVDTGMYPQNVAPYLYYQTYGSSSTLNDFSMRTTGPIAHLPWGDPTAAVAIEHRTEGFPTSNQTDFLSTASNAASKSFAALNGIVTYFGQHQSTNSLYIEGHVPLISGLNAMPGLRELELQAADRIERYDVVTGTSSESVGLGGTLPGGVVVNPSICYSPSLDPQCQIPVPRATTSYSSNNATFGVKYKPVDSVTVRASFATAFLPPNYGQLLPNPQIAPNGDTITDPKTGSTYQVNVVSGGNPNLKPESDKNWDIGIIFEPQDRILKGLRVDLEFVQIKRFDAIVTISGDQILGDPALAGRVTRNPATGLVTQINESFINANEDEYEGYDLSVNYTKASDIGTFEFVARGSISEHNKEQVTAGSPLVELVGDIPAGGQIKTAANATLTWAKGPWKLGWTTRWFDGYYSIDPTGNNLRISSQTYHDFFAKYSIDPLRGKLLANSSVELGIKDIFNTAPPFDPNFAPFYRSPVGDIRMQEWRLGVRKSF